MGKLNSIFVKIGALSAASAVALGAFGAHGLKTHLAENPRIDYYLDVWKTASNYHLMHSLAMVMGTLIVDCCSLGVDCSAFTELCSICTFVVANMPYLFHYTFISFFFPRFYSLFFVFSPSAYSQPFPPSAYRFIIRCWYCCFLWILVHSCVDSKL